MLEWTQEEFALLSKRLLELEMDYDIVKINKNELIIKRNENILAKYDCISEKLITYGKTGFAYFK